MRDAPQRATGIELAELSGGLLVRQAEPRRVHQLNNTASMVLELCDGRHTVAQIAEVLAAAFTLDGPPLAEVAACVSELRHAGILRPSKTQQKISGRLLSEKATRDRYAIRGYAFTAAKHGIAVFTAIRDALTGNPWIPPIPASA
jgi:hypothetical protein